MSTPTAEPATTPRGADHAPVVVDPAGLTAEWIAAATGIDCVAVDVHPVGTGQMATAVQVRTTTGTGPGPGPALFVKLPCPDEGMRAMLHGVYRSEVMFYRALAPTLAVRVPGCRYAAMGAGDGEFTLVLDDAAPLVQADQLAGMTPEQVLDCAVNLAGLHGPRWCDPTLDAIEGLSRPTPEDNAALAEMAEPCFAAFLAGLGDRLTARERQVVAAIPPIVGPWADARTERLAPVHGDFRADNMLVDPADTRPSLACDWQTLALAQPGRDLGYLVATGLDPEPRRAHERAIVTAYHRALLGHGVTGYDLDTCWDDYVHGLLQGPVLGLFGWMYGTRSERGDRMFTVMVRRAVAAIDEHDALGRLGG